MMNRLISFYGMVFAFGFALCVEAQAVTLQWDPDSGNAREWNTTTNNWTQFSGGSQDFYVNGGGDVRFRNGNSVNTGTPARTGNVFIGTGATPTAVSPGGEVLFTNGGGTYNFSGGDITDFGLTPTSMRIVWDLFVNFNYASSLSFSGGTGVGTGSATNAGTIAYNVSSASGNYHFGTGDITFGNKGGNFQFNPDAVATLTNNIIFDNTSGDASRIFGNGNARFSGLVTVNPGANFSRGTGNFVSTNATGILLNGNEDFDFSFNSAGTNFQTNVDGQGIHSVRLVGNTGGGNPDWVNKLTEASTPWNIKNLTKTGINKTFFDVDETTFFSTLTANGGRFLIEGGVVQFRDANPTINFNLAVVPNAATNKSGYGDYAGFYQVSSLNVVDGGRLSGTKLAKRNSLPANSTFDNNLVVNINGGTLAPGQGAGIMNVAGSVNFIDPTSTLEIQLGGTTAGTEYDQLVATGNISLGGLLDVSFINDFEDTVSALDTFTIITGLTVGGTFENLVLGRVDMSDGKGSFLVTVSGTNVVLSNFELPPVPEPGTATLLGLGMLGLVARRKRKLRS